MGRHFSKVGATVILGPSNKKSGGPARLQRLWYKFTHCKHNNSRKHRHNRKLYKDRADTRETEQYCRSVDLHITTCRTLVGPTSITVLIRCQNCQRWYNQGPALHFANIHHLVCRIRQGVLRRLYE